jgi:hypothetical protein
VQVLMVMKELRIVTKGFRGGGTQTGPLRDARRFTSTRSEGYAYDVGDWYLSIVQGTFSVVPRAQPLTLSIRFETFSSLYTPTASTPASRN